MFDLNNTGTSSMEAMGQRLQRMRSTCGSSQRNWLATQAMQRNGSMEITDEFSYPFFLFSFFLSFFLWVWVWVLIYSSFGNSTREEKSVGYFHNCADKIMRWAQAIWMAHWYICLPKHNNFLREFYHNKQTVE